MLVKTLFFQFRNFIFVFLLDLIFKIPLKMVMAVRQHQIAVVGAGPAGLAVVGKLLDCNLKAPILWIDPSFECGRLAVYKNVPSNTKVKLFVQYATLFESFKAVWKDDQLKNYPSLAALKELNQEEGCKLEYAANMVHDLINGLGSTYKSRLSLSKGLIERMEKIGDHWKLGNSAGEEFICQKVILATGSHPRLFSPSNQDHIECITLDKVLSDEMGSFSTEDSVAVIGSSHSAMLVVKILSEMTGRPRKVINFYRSPLKFAEYLPDNRIKHDNTGLKGEVAHWVRSHIVDGHKTFFDGFLERVPLEGDETGIYTTKLRECTKLVPAVGYDRNQLPTIKVDGQTIDGLIDYDGKCQIMHQGLSITGLYGVGIAFPERVLDVDGSPEQAVGLWKFIRYIDRVIPEIILQ